jgi:hypothetical protein
MSKNPNTPTRKVGAGALAGAIVTVGVWLTPADEPAAVVAALVTAVTFIVSYFVPEAE